MTSKQVYYVLNKIGNWSSLKPFFGLIDVSLPSNKNVDNKNYTNISYHSSKGYINFNITWTSRFKYAQFGKVRTDFKTKKPTSNLNLIWTKMWNFTDFWMTVSPEAINSQRSCDFMNDRCCEVQIQYHWVQ